MPLVPVTPPPGVVKPGTVYDARGRWYDTNLVRWFEGVMQAVGGWEELLIGGSQADVGARAAGTHAWKTDSGAARLAIGTPDELYVLGGSSLTDATPAGFTTGADDASYSAGGFGAGLFGAGLFGVGDPAVSDLTEAESWQLDNLGEDLVGVALTDGLLYYWDSSAGGAADEITPSAGTVPTNNLGVVVTPENFLMLLGANGLSRRVFWADQDDHTDWDTTSTTNQAGFFDLPGKGNILAGRRSQAETLVWTDTDLFSVRYIGGQFVYTPVPVGSDGAASRRSMIIVGSKAYYMGRRGFYVYDGFVSPLPSPVGDYVFSDLNRVQLSKVWAELRTEYGEILWHYPSGASTECNRVVVYNYKLDVWYTHRGFKRTGGEDQGVFDYPISIDEAGLLWRHETGSEYDAGLTPYAESGPIEIGNGTNVMHIQSLVPDEETLGDLSLYLYTSFYPTAAETSNGPYTPANPTDVRLTARQVRLRIEQDAAGWRVGTIRLDVEQGGER